MANKYYFSTKDLLLIAMIGCLGGVMSTYVGYVAMTFGSLTGIPMGGQLLAGLHVFWIILAMAIVNKKGSGVAVGLLDGFIEFITGGHLGILAIAVGLLEGIFAEIGFWPLKKYRTLSFLIAGGLSSWANILVTQTILDAFPGVYLFGTLSVFSFVSGVVFAGLIGLGVVDILVRSGVVKGQEKPASSTLSKLPGACAVVIATFVVILFALHFSMPAKSTVTAPAINASAANNTTETASQMVFTDTCKSMGNNTYDLMEYQSKFITVTATDPTGGNTIARNYTGLPLVVLVNMQCPGGSPRYVDVFGKDGSKQTFNVTDIRADENIMLVPNGTAFDIVAPGYPSNMWVKNVDRFSQY